MIPDIQFSYNMLMDFKPNIWYLVKTKHKMEDLVEINLTNQSIEYFLPRYACGKREGKVIFSGYIFVRPNSNHTYQSIRSTMGVNDFVRFNLSFAIASNEMIDQLRAEVNAMNNRMDQTNQHQKGEEIFIKKGPFKEFSGIFEKYDVDQSVIVLINFLRHHQRVKIKADMIA